jgi:hypothetical protein
VSSLACHLYLYGPNDTNIIARPIGYPTLASTATVPAMPTTLPHRDPSTSRKRVSAANTETAMLWAMLFVALQLALVTGVVPAALVLPTLAVLLVLTGVFLGVYRLLAGRSHSTVSEALTDVAGALVLLGFAAAILSDKAEAVAALGALHGAP